MARSIAAAIDELDGRADVQVLVLTGAGGRFSAGMDLKGFLAADAPVAADRGFGGIVERPAACCGCRGASRITWRWRSP